MKIKGQNEGMGNLCRGVAGRRPRAPTSGAPTRLLAADTFSKGFTLVELMIGMIAAAILALAAGTMLANTWKGWFRSQAVADMERDAAVAIHTLDLAVRGASNAVWNGTTLTVYTNATPRVFSKSGVSPYGSLVYNGMTVVDGRLVSFSAPVTGRVVSVTLILAGINQNDDDTGVRMGVTNMCIRMRNVP